MSVIHYYFLVISSILQISKTSPPKKHVYFQIDEFIKQLMTSEKFDELADVIADKAAQKIRDMDTPSIRHGSKSVLRNLDKKDTTDTKPGDKPHHERDHSNDIDLQLNEKLFFLSNKKRGKDTRTEEKSSHTHETNKERDLKSEGEKRNYETEKNKGKDLSLREKLAKTHEKQKEKYSRSDEKIERERKFTGNSHSQKNPEKIDKIDTQTFLENQLASKELELNFKHLKGELEKHRFDVKHNSVKSHKSHDKDKRHDHDENNRAVDDNEDEDEKNENDTIKRTLKQIDSKELLLSEGSNEKEAHEQATFHDQKKQMQNFGENKSIPDSEAVDEKRVKTFKYDHNSNEKPVPRITKQNNSEEDNNANEDVELAKTFIDKVMDKVSQELNHPSYSSKEVLVVGINRARSHDNKTSTYSEKLKDNISDSNKHFIDNEDDKFSTLKTSAEYADSHENLSIKRKPKFINTYK